MILHGGRQHLLRPGIDSTAPLTSRVYSVKKSHKKSRNGCDSCKARRVKCDEAWPCGQCRRRKCECTFRRFSNTDPALSLHMNKLDCAQLIPQCQTSVDPKLLLRFWSEVILRMTGAANVWKPSAEMVVAVLQDDHTVCATLALLDLHARVHNGSQIQGQRETFHLTKAIGSLRRSIQSDWDKEADAVLGTAYILNAIHFVDLRPTETHQPANKRPRLGWLRVQVGFVPLIWQASQRATSKLWLPFFRGHGLNVEGMHDERPGTLGIPSEFVELYQITETSTCNEHPYLRLLRRICRMLEYGRKTENAILFFQFVQGLSADFLQRLEGMDPKALLLCAYWFGCLCSVDLWWCRNRALYECRTICWYLYREYPSLRGLLMCPATWCEAWCCGLECKEGGES